MLVRDYRVRVFIVFSCFVTLFFIVVIRLFLIQLYQKNFFKILAKQQYEVNIILNPARALVYERTGTFPLVFNRELPSAFIIPQQLTQPDKIKKFLASEYPDVYKRLLQNPDKHFLWLDRKLIPEKYNTLKRTGLKDIHIIGEFQRFYTLKSASQLIGYTDIDSVGIAGIELMFSKDLQGQATRVTCEKDARSGLLYFNKHIQKQGLLGTPITLSIDRILQAQSCYELQKTVDALQAQGGSVVVMNPCNGEILAMGNYPTFDPNQKGIVDLELMKNSAVCECYELGSVMKAFSALASLEEGVVGLDELIDCEGRFAFIDGFRVENPTIQLLNLLAQRNNILSFHDVVRYSSNVGIAKIAQRLESRLYLHLRRLGFGTKTGIEFPGERDGFVNPPERWSRSSLIVMSFGYEFMASVLQLACAFGIIANNGCAVKPTLLKQNKLIAQSQALYSERAVIQLKSILAHVCERHQIPGVQVMGKTGTVRCVKNGKYSDKDHNYTFAGIVEKGTYKRVIVALIKEPQKAHLWASEVALPLFSRIAEKMVVRDCIHNGCVA